MVLSSVRTVITKGLLEYFLSEWRDKGDLAKISLASNTYLAVHPNAVELISQNVGEGKAFSKVESYKVVRNMLLGEGLTTSVGRIWKTHRGEMALYFTPSGVADYIPILTKEALKLTNSLEDKKTIDICEIMAQFSAKVVLRCLFSDSNDEEISSLSTMSSYLIAASTSRSFSPIKLSMNIPTPDHVKYRRVYKELTEYLNVIVTKRKALNHLEWPNDILSRLLTSETMTSKQIRDHLITLFVAGADTTGKLVGFALYALAINPEVDERLYQEITNVSSFSLDTFHKMPLMLQMLKETLRKWPPAPFYIRDLVTAFQIDQVKLLPGDAVMLSPFLTGMHKDFWDKPEKFDINRFSPEEESIRHKYAFHAFASGPRNCIGQHFAYLEATIALGIILREYRVVLPKFYLPELTMTGTLTPKGGLPMQFVKRH